MSRLISSVHRSSLEASHGSDEPFIFLRLSHASLSADIFVVNDSATENGQPVTYEYDGETWIAFPFEVELLTDTDEPPSGKIEISNVSDDVGEALRDVVGAVDIEIILLSTSEFDLTVNPRTVISSPPVPIYTATGLALRNVQVDIMNVTGEIGSIDDTKEPYPSMLVTEALAPGLYK